MENNKSGAFLNVCIIEKNDNETPWPSVEIKALRKYERQVLQKEQVIINFTNRPCLLFFSSSSSI